MEAFNDLQQLWLSTSVKALPHSGELLKTIRAHRRKAMLTSAAAMAFGIVLLAVMVWVLFAYKSAYITTRIGEACLLLAIGIFLAAKFTIFKKALNSSSYSNANFLKALKDDQLSLLTSLKRMQGIGFAFASSGLLLYVYEEAAKNSHVVLALSLVAAWLALNWFVVRPFALRRRLKKDAEAIQRIEQIINQL
ncbi:MAG: hypothetical protein K0S09_1649 [Sphingobacteriaceae bacterium]|jgi:hypothetical protein|nr:hypothetical protein [Sphingobacteriaceae bacterium]